jgi:type I restriction enzyme S subunit
MGTCGRCAIVPDSIPTAINTKHLCCITLDRTKCLPAFLHEYFLRHPIARRYLAERAKGAIMEGLNMGIIKELPIPRAPIALQQEFVDKLKTVNGLVGRVRQSEAGLDMLFACLQDRAFQGALSSPGPCVLTG